MLGSCSWLVGWKKRREGREKSPTSCRKDAKGTLANPDVHSNFLQLFPFTKPSFPQTNVICWEKKNWSKEKNKRDSMFLKDLKIDCKKYFEIQRYLTPILFIEDNLILGTSRDERMLRCFRNTPGSKSNCLHAQEMEASLLQTTTPAFPASLFH